MTTITVQRATVAEDIYGDPKPVSWSTWSTFEGEVGWGNPDESIEVGRNTVITNRTVLIRGAAPSGILSTDRVVIGGVTYDIDGAVAEWGDPHVGTQFAVRLAT